MGMELRRGVAVNRPRGVVLEGRGNEFARRLRRMDIADARLRVPLQLVKRHADTLPMRLPHAVIAAHKRGERYRLRRGERRIPSGAMFHAGHLLAVFVLRRFAKPDAGRAALPCLGMLAFAQSREVLSANCTVQAPLLGELALPFAMSLLIAAPVVLLLRSKLPRMVRPCLAG